MDRLLTDEEIKNAVYDKPEKGSARWTKIVIPRDNRIAKAQDAKTAHLVAQEIFKELEEQFGLYSDGENGQLELDMIVIKPGDYYSTEDALERYKAMKSKRGIEC